MKSERGSALVEAIAMMALLALLISALFSIALTIQTQNELRHAAALAARSGAIAGEESAKEKARDLLQGKQVGQSFSIVKSDGPFYFEVRLTQYVRTIFGVRRVAVTGHSLMESWSPPKI